MLKTLSISPSELVKYDISIKQDGVKRTAFELLSFPNISMNDLIKIVKRYKDGNAWKENITINEEEFKHIQDIMKASNELDNYVEYDKLIFNEFFKDYE